MDERAALERAAALASRAGRTSPNPKVGCVIVDRAGNVLGEGYHRAAGQPHAEVEALTAAGPAARGATAVVTLEPCTHTGRTGPCTEALLTAGVARVVVGRRDPNPVAGGGIDALRDAGVDAVLAEPSPAVEALNRYWETAARHGRPAVIWKTAATLDGRVAAADGTSQWITGPTAREQVHRLRAEVDAVLVGSGTALADDPSLTVRLTGETAEQPLRVVVGDRPLPAGARLHDDAAATLQLARQEPAAVLQQLWDADVRSVLLEGGPTMASAFLAEDLVDFVVWFTAPLLLGAGASALQDIGVATLAQGRRFSISRAETVGDDIRLDLARQEA